MLFLTHIASYWKMEPNSGSDEETFGCHDLVGPAELKKAGTSEITFDGLLHCPLKLHQDLKNGCGGQVWDAGMVLAKYMLRKHGETVKGKSMCALWSIMQFILTPIDWR